MSSCDGGPVGAIDKSGLAVDTRGVILGLFCFILLVCGGLGHDVSEELEVVYTCYGAGWVLLVSDGRFAGEIFY